MVILIRERLKLLNQNRGYMFTELNRQLRKLILVLGAVFALFKLIEKIELPQEPEEEGFQTHEFDDIW